MSDYGYEDLSAEDKAEELADLRQRMMVLQGAPAPAPPPAAAAEPDRAQFMERLNAATSQEEMNAAAEEYNAQVRQYNAPPPPPPIDHAALNQAIANAKSQDEVMALLQAAGMPTSHDGWD